MMYRILILSSLIILSSTSASQDIEKILTSNEVELTIKPHICVAPRGESSCISTIDISWKSIRNGDYCLETDFTNSQLQCWENKDSGFYQHKIVFNKNITYSIKDKKKQQILAYAIMKFKSLRPHRKYKSRRSRFPWSITSL